MSRYAAFFPNPMHRHASPLAFARNALNAALGLIRNGGVDATVLHAVNSVPHGLCIYDAEDRLVFANEGFGRIYGCEVATLPVGTSFFDVIAHSVAVGNYAGFDVDEIWAERKAFIDRREAGTFLQALGDGRLISITHQPLSREGWAAVYEDITERRRDEARLRYLAHHDALTGLPNRLQFDQRLRAELSACSIEYPTALLCLDLDGFKPVNDAFGHPAGDAVLRQVAERLNEGLRPTDMAARLGGDEFAVLLPGADSQTARRVAARIRSLLSQPYVLDGEVRVIIGTSVGVACAPTQTATPEALFAFADEALYHAKRASRDRPGLRRGEGSAIAEVATCPARSAPQDDVARSAPRGTEIAIAV